MNNSNFFENNPPPIRMNFIRCFVTPDVATVKIYGGPSVEFFLCIVLGFFTFSFVFFGDLFVSLFFGSIGIILIVKALFATPLGLTKIIVSSSEIVISRKLLGIFGYKKNFTLEKIEAIGIRKEKLYSLVEEEILCIDTEEKRHFITLPFAKPFHQWIADFLNYCLQNQKN